MIIAATDFSASAIDAANYAADLAIAINADLLLFHVSPEPLVFGGVVSTNSPRGITIEAKDELKEQVQQIRKKIGSGKLKIVSELRMGSFSNELKAVCEKESPYAVVMGSQGTTATERFLFGSHTVHAVKHLLWPVITVPAGVNFSTIKKIAFACDFGSTEAVPMEEIKMLVKEFNCELHIINVGKEHGHLPMANLNAGWLKAALDPIQPIYQFIDDINTDVAIMDFAETNQIDLLIVLPKRRGFFDRFVYTSTSEHLVLHCHVPVMALHQ